MCGCVCVCGCPFVCARVRVSACVRACVCRLRHRGKLRSKTMAERLLAEDIQRNRLAQMRAVTYLLLLVSEGSMHLAWRCS